MEADYLDDPQERLITLRSGEWDNRAALFIERQPPRTTRDLRSQLDFTGSAMRELAETQVRQFEYMLNRDLRQHPMADRVLALGQTANEHRPLHQAARRAFSQIIAQVSQTEARLALNAFRAALHPERLKALHLAGHNSVGSYNWLVGPNLRRAQAIIAFPLAWRVIATTGGLAHEAVESGSPLIPALGREVGVPATVLKRMNGLGLDSTDLLLPPRDHAMLKSLAKEVAHMPPGPSPTTAAGWKAYFNAVRLTHRVSLLTNVGDSTQTRDALLASSAGKWDTMDHQVLSQAADGFTDMLMDLHANLFDPMARIHGFDTPPLHEIAKVVVGNRSLSQLAEVSATWHADQGAIHAQLSGAFPSEHGTASRDAWPPLHEGGVWTATNGCRVHVLTDVPMLDAEHREMVHCVNTYGPMCLYTGSHILSVRSPDGQAIGTAEIKQGEIIKVAKTLAEPPNAPVRSLPPSVTQFMAVRNRVPVTEAWVALWDYVSAIMTGGLEIKGEFLETALRHRLARRGDAPIQDACYDIRTPDAVMAAWRRYSVLLPKSVARRGPEAMLRSTHSTDYSSTQPAADRIPDAALVLR